MQCEIRVFWPPAVKINQISHGRCIGYATDLSLVLSATLDVGLIL